MATSATDPGGSGLSTIEFSNDEFTWTTPQTYAATVNLTVPTGDGSRLFYARVSDVAGNFSVAPFPTATILIDQTAPVSGTVSVNSGAAATPAALVALAITASESGGSGLARMCIKSGTMTVTFTAPAAGDPCWMAYGTTQPYTLSSTAEGNHRVFVWFRDAVGNINATPALDDIFFDTQVPTAPSGLTLVSVVNRTVTLSMTLGTDPPPAAPPLRVQIGHRMNGRTGPFTFALSTATGTPGQVTVNLSRGIRVFGPDTSSKRIW